jgi:hypothetical protein
MFYSGFIKNSLVGLFLLITGLVTAQESPHIEEKFEVDGVQYKARVTQVEKYVFKLKIYQSVDGKWVKIFRKIVDSDFFHNIELLDWNHDGHLDVKFRLVDGATVEGYHTLVLYKGEGEFQEVTNYWLYVSSFEPDDFLISTDPLVYYSNIRWGCAGGDYESVLYTLDADTVRVLANAQVNYCMEPFDVTVNNVDHGKYTRYNVYADGYIENSSAEGDWREFMNHFWRHHFVEFIDQ